MITVEKNKIDFVKRWDEITLLKGQIKTLATQLDSEVAALESDALYESCTNDEDKAMLSAIKSDCVKAKDLFK
jgi:hypothetical protein